MSFLNTNKFQDRQAAAAAARKAMAEKFASRPKYDPNDPAVQKREAERRAILESREQREIERAKRKAEAEAAEAARKLAEEAARQEELRLQALHSEAEEASRRAEAERIEFERKLERDARYAARKARKVKKKTAAERWG
jgi:Family of unknown function (DUF6481)